MMRNPFVAAGLATLITFGSAGLAAPAFAQGHWARGQWDWNGGRDDDRRAYDLAGPGVSMLFPELRQTRRGRAFVARNFDLNHDGFLTPREARAANRAFAEATGPDRGRFDWAWVDRGGYGRMPSPPPVVGRPGGWDRQAMRAYNFRDTPEGARMTMQENVLFQTDSAELRPGAIDKLQALAGYLRGNGNIRIAIDGYTDSRGTAAHNQDLSVRRAEAIRGALDGMGVTRARFRVRGHGENDPVATNATAQGMRLNRRVEITLLGQRKSSFG
jgi:outer membrane protein OmpA-like peptidoglycan-associated protein